MWRWCGCVHVDTAHVDMVCVCVGGGRGGCGDVHKHLGSHTMLEISLLARTNSMQLVVLGQSSKYICGLDTF